MGRTRYDIGQIIRDHYQDFFSSFKVVPQVRKSFSAMAVCRTRYLGGHVDVCPECGEVHVSYNSCRDRHCPKCQNKEREQWIDMRREEIIPKAKYFHVVFTIPDSLHPLAMHFMNEFYSTMFRAAWKTLEMFFKAQRLKGGMTGILHTWGSNMHYHPHIHCIVPGGGIDKDGVWHSLDGCKGAGDFLFPVQALSKVFRAKFMSLLAKALKPAGGLIREDIRKQCFAKRWCVYSRPPAKGVELVLEYIGRYAYRVAISNSRIMDYDGERVTYDWKDYRSGGKHRTMTMKAVDFLHLFSLHILPKGMVRIRHYGLMSPSNRDRLREVQAQLGGNPVPKYRPRKPYLQICQEHGWKIGVCPCCNAELITIETINPSRAPPLSFLRRRTACTK